MEPTRRASNGKYANDALIATIKSDFPDITCSPETFSNGTWFAEDICECTKTFAC